MISAVLQSRLFRALQPAVPILVAFASIPRLGAAETTATAPVLLDTFRITAERALASDVEGADSIESYSPDDIADSGAFSIDEFLATLPPDTSGGEQLILIDGRPTYIDPSKLPPGMIETVEVSNEGSMPQYGAYATGRIINVRLKKDYRGGEIGLRISDTLSGGGGQRTLRTSVSMNRGKLRLFYSVALEKSDALYSAERDFSREQDHTGRGGRDLRLAWGYPAVIEAVSGHLNGVFTPEGGSSSVALVPESAPSHTLAPADFTAGTAGASGQRRFNTSAYQLLQSPSKRASLNFGGSYALAGRTEISFSGSHSESRGTSQSAPPVTAASDATVVPAALNPFGQDVRVGLVHTGFGPVRQESESRNTQLGARLNGRTGQTWSWSAGLGYRRSESEQVATDLDRDKFSQALRAPDPALRFDPFGNPGSAAHNATLYPELTILRTNHNLTENSRLDLSANGQTFESWGGPATLSLNAEASNQRQHRQSVNSLSTASPESRQSRNGFSVSAATTVPLVSNKQPLPIIQRLETQFSAAYSGRDDSGSGRDADAGLVWVPVRGLLLRAKYGLHVDEPSGRVVASPTSLTRETIVDPRRADSAANEVPIVSREDFQTRASRSDRVILGASLEIPRVEGLRLSASYRLRRRHHLLQRQFDAQDLIDNEALFPGRILREDPSAADLAAGLPGRIVSIDVTPGTAGEASNQDLDMNLNYTRAVQGWGRLRLAVFADHVIEARQQTEAGALFTSTQSNRLNPPAWTSGLTLGWATRRWNVSTLARHTSAGISDPAGTEGYTAVNLNFSLLVGGAGTREAFGKGLRLGFGVTNLFDTAPTRADTVSGYRLGSALGRAFSVTVSQNF